MQSNSLPAHLISIIALPFTVTVLVPLAVYDLWPPVPYGVSFRVAGGLILLAGFGLAAWSVYLFASMGRGTLAPWSPTKRLVVYGPYRYCRNPMITGVCGILLGEALILQSAGIFAWLFLFFLINNIYFLLREEPDLRRRFGKEYVTYCRHVPRWIPRVTPYQTKKPGDM